MRNLILGGMLALLALGGCGKKEFPQPDTSQPLRIVGLQSTVNVSILQLSFTILGGFGNVGYQIDRAEVDPVCDCLTAWQRHFEQPALPNQKGRALSRNFKLVDPDRSFAFRIRAVDTAGNLSPWSAPVRASAVAHPK